MDNQDTEMIRLLTVRLDREALCAELTREPGLAAIILSDLAAAAPAAPIAPLVADYTFQGDRMKAAQFFYQIALKLDTRSAREISMIEAAVSDQDWSAKDET